MNDNLASIPWKAFWDMLKMSTEEVCETAKILALYENWVRVFEKLGCAVKNGKSNAKCSNGYITFEWMVENDPFFIIMELKVNHPQAISYEKVSLTYDQVELKALDCMFKNMGYETRIALFEENKYFEILLEKLPSGIQAYLARTLD